MEGRKVHPHFGQDDPRAQMKTLLGSLEGSLLNLESIPTIADESLEGMRKRSIEQIKNRLEELRVLVPYMPEKW